jgi:putative SOS response-associated peptidase YedK
VCGRFVLTSDLDDWVGTLEVDEVLTEPLPPSWNVAPTDPVYAVAEHDGRRQLGTMGWGLIPHWAKQARSRHINARSETIATTPAFRESLARRRCLVPSNGFYEWATTANGRIPHHVALEAEPMVFAGVWSGWTDPATGQRVRTVAIVTAEARPELAVIHDRMPVWLAPDLWGDWLDRATTDPASVLPLFEWASPGTVVVRPVGDAVGNVRNNRPELLTDREDMPT